MTEVDADMADMDEHIKPLAEAFAGRSAAPAGGAAAALALTVGAALGEKVARLTRKHRRGQPGDSVRDASEHALRAVWSGSIPKFGQDCDAVRAMLAARRAGAGHEPDGGDQMEMALRVPFQVIDLACDGVRALGDIAAMVKPHLACDIAASAHLMLSAADMSLWNLEQNAGASALSREWRDRVDQARRLVAGAHAIHATITRPMRVAPEQT